MSYKKKIRNIDAVCFFTKDFEGSKRFFENVWGFVPKRIQPPVEETGYTTNFIEYKFKGATIAIWDRKEVADIMGAKNLEGDGCNYMTAVKLPTVSDLDKVYHDFVNKGVVCISKPTRYDFGSTAAYFLDHEKNIWEFFAWDEGGDGPALVRGNDGIIESNQEECVLTDDMRFDRIEAMCLFPKNFEKMRRFYEEVFGFVPKRIQKDGVDPTVQNPNFIEYQFRTATFALWARSAVSDIMGEENLKENAHNFMTAIRVEKPEDVDEVYNEFTKLGVKCLSMPRSYHFGSRAAYFADPEDNIWEVYAWLNGKDGPSLVE